MHNGDNDCRRYVFSEFPNLLFAGRAHNNYEFAISNRANSIGVAICIKCHYHTSERSNDRKEWE